MARPTNIEMDAADAYIDWKQYTGGEKKEQARLAKAKTDLIGEVAEKRDFSMDEATQLVEDLVTRRDFKKYDRASMPRRGSKSKRAPASSNGRRKVTKIVSSSDVMDYLSTASDEEVQAFMSARDALKGIRESIRKEQERHDAAIRDEESQHEQNMNELLKRRDELIAQGMTLGNS